MTDCSNSGHIISAHRGGAIYVPENTLAAIEWTAAHAMGHLELDTSLLGDGTAVLSHDGTLDRCTDASGPLTAIGRADLDGIDAGGWFDAKFAGQPLPTLEAGLVLMKRLDITVNLEFKTHAGADAEPAAQTAEREALVESALAALDASGFPLERFRASSFDHALLERLHARRPAIATAVLARELPTDWHDIAQRAGAVSVNLNYQHATPEAIAEVITEGLEVHLYTPNDPNDVAALWSAGLTGIITDDPIAFLATRS